MRNYKRNHDIGEFKFPFSFQLCINLANERLQGYFNQRIFDMELNDCAEEGISMTNIQFTRNKPILDLFLGVRSIRTPDPYIAQTEFSKFLIRV